MSLFVATCTTDVDAACSMCARPVTVSYTGSAVSVTYGADILCSACMGNTMLRSDGMGCEAAATPGK